MVTVEIPSAVEPAQPERSSTAKPEVAVMLLNAKGSLLTPCGQVIPLYGHVNFLGVNWEAWA